MRKASKRSTSKLMYIPKKEEVPAESVLQTIYYQSLFQRGRIHLEKEEKSDLMMDSSHVFAVTPANYWDTENLPNFAKIGSFAINFMREMLALAEKMGDDTVELWCSTNGPLIAKLKAITIVTAPRGEQ